VTLDAAIETVRDRFPFEKYMDPYLGKYRHIAGTLKRYLPSGGTVLDVGCGPCDSLAVLSVLGYRCFGLDDLDDHWHKLGDNRQRILLFAREMGIDLRIPSSGEPPFGEQRFDLVMLNHVLEHLHDSPRTLANSLLESVEDGGLFLITVPNAVNIRKRIDVLFGRTNLPDFDLYYWHPDPWRGHVREYTRGDLACLARNLDLDVVELHSCDHMLFKLPAAARPLYLAATRVFSGWKDSWLLLARKRAGWKPREIAPEEFAKIAGRFSSYPY
jgi:SAM-dependent methyltransferase